jgi:hypothetical protein
MQNHGTKAQIINKSIFEWDQVENSPCFFLALEVIDNFPHDAVRYDYSRQTRSGTPQMLQTFVVENGNDYQELYEDVSDPLILRYLNYRKLASFKTPTINPYWKYLKNIPFSSNLSDPEFIPTMQMSFLEILKKFFPQQRLILSDFYHLPTPIVGLNAPIVQTRQRYQMIPCSSYLLSKGWFDIFFPTNFELMADMYALINKKNGRVFTHKDFLIRYADLNSSSLQNGENPMLDHFQNVKFFLS